MLPQGNRLRKTREFERVFSSRLVIPGQLLRIAYAKNDVTKTRCGIVISTKVSKKATLRNKLRRRIRTIISRSIPLLVPAMDIVIICGSKAIKADFKEIEEEIKRSLERIFKKNL